MAGYEEEVVLKGMAVSGFPGQTGSIAVERKDARYHTGKSVRVY